MAVASFKVPGMSCERCAEAVSNAVGSLWGVCGVTVDLPTKSVTVNYTEDEVKPPAIKERIEETGYEVTHHWEPQALTRHPAVEEGERRSAI